MITEEDCSSKSNSSKQPLAAVYRGELSCDGCAESVGNLLKKSPVHYKVQYVGPKEKEDINSKTLEKFDLLAWPGGGDDVKKDFKRVSHYTKSIQDFIGKGNLYAGFCFGAYLAKGQGKDEQFFDLLPKGSYVAGERFQNGAQVKSAHDTIIEIDWTFGSGKQKGETVKDRWQYFQDGATIYLEQDIAKRSIVLGRYSYTQNISSAIIPYGKGSVGLIGFHPEADQSWYDDYNIHNPQNVSHQLGYDFIQTLYQSRDHQSQSLHPRSDDDDNGGFSLNLPFVHVDVSVNSSSALRFGNSVQTYFSLSILFLALLFNLQLLKRH